MRAFLSKLLLTIFIFVFAVPGTLFAQNTWTSPAGGPPLNNVEAPINTTEFPQEKRGALTIDGGFQSRGGTLLNNALTPDPLNPDLFVSFVPAFFYNNINVGSFGITPTVNILGNLKYKPNGGTQPQAGKVLKSTDTDGTIAWAPGIPDGVNQGDTLIWNDTCNCWETGPGGGGGNGAMPLGTLGQTIWHNGTDWEATDQIKHGTYTDTGGVLQTRTDLYNHLTFVRSPNILMSTPTAGSSTTINSREIRLAGGDSVWVGTNGSGLTRMNSGEVIFKPLNGGTQPQDVKLYSDTVEFNNTSPLSTQTLSVNSADVAFNNVNVAQQVDFNSSNVNFNNPQGTTQQVDVNSSAVRFDNPAGGNQTTTVMSSTVNFGEGDDDGVTQTTTFNSDVVKFKNINMAPGTGRIPYAQDDEGTYGWNENFTYNLNQGGSTPIGQLTLHNPQGGVALLQNEGLSQLMDDVYIEDTGSLYLYGINSAAASQRGIGIIKPLCYVTTTKKVVTCADDPITEAPTGPSEVGPAFDTDYEIFRTVEHNAPSPLSSYTFQSNQTVDIKFCGGGGGGGGGGAGAANSGGGGGGGGAAGNCQTLNDLVVAPGDKLSWTIGDGGNYGNGTKKQTFVSGSGNISQIATDGSTGLPTSVFMDYADNGFGNPVPLGQTQAGGLGGKKGKGSLDSFPSGTVVYDEYVNSTGQTITAGYLGGPGANNSLPIYHDGYNGCGIYNCQGSPKGGMGGDGENPTGSLLPTTPSAGGNPAIDDWADNVTSDHLTNRNGGPGYAGLPGNGGGGGGGGFGSAQYTNVDAGVSSFPPIVLWTKWPGGGNGAKGGSGYVQVSGILNNALADSVEFNTPSSVDVAFPVSAIPVAEQTVTIEVWGGAGGGGGVKTGFLAERHAAGGGGAGYVKIPNVLKSQLGTTLLIRVGAGGTAGVSSGTGSSVTNGGLGGTSYIKVSGSSTNIANASGGAGGSKDNDNDSAEVPGAVGGSGQPGPSPFIDYPSITTSQGTNGTTGSGGNNVQGGSISAGGTGADTSLMGGTSTNSSAGQNGKVRISW